MHFTQLTTLAVTLTIVAGCGTDRTEALPTRTTVPRLSTTVAPSASTLDPTPTTLAAATTTAKPVHPAVTAALGFWDRYIEITGRPGPFDPTTIRFELDQFTTGAETAKLFEFVQGNMLAGRTLQGTIDHSPRLASVDSETAIVVDCMDDKTGIYAADGTRVDTDDPNRHPATIGLRLVGGAWKVETISISAEVCAP